MGILYIIGGLILLRWPGIVLLRKNWFYLDENGNSTQIGKITDQFLGVLSILFGIYMTVASFLDGK